jgi:hypothetical protein
MYMVPTWLQFEAYAVRVTTPPSHSPLPASPHNPQGLMYMVPPWLQYEAYAVRVTNNAVSQTAGAALGVAGGYDVLVAYNTVYK